MKVKKMTLPILAIVIACLVFVILSVRKENSLQKDSVKWPTTEAVVTESKVVRQWEKNSGAPKTAYKVELKYNYTVEQKTYLGERYSFGKPLIFNASSDAEKIVAEYPLGRKISVYYMPSNPQESAIIR